MELCEGKVAKWYNGKSIFITGGTGFMGKVLVEKLLFSFKNINNIYVLMRPKRGKSVEQRINDIWKLPVFQRLHESDPEAKSKIIPIHGDLVTDNLGISDQEMQILIENASVVFHCAATLKLEATLKDAIEQNTAGTQRVADVVKKFKYLDVFIHVSTAFCSADLESFEEKVYDCKDNPRDVIEAARWMSDESLIQVTKPLIYPHVNTYTYSKRLAECLVADEAKGKMKVAIVRPSIVTPCGVEPVPGWVDTLNGPMGLMVAAGKGVLRSMHCHGHYNAQTIPCDLAINALILVAYKVGSAAKMTQVPVFNMTNDGVLPVTWGEVLGEGRKLIKQYPFEQMIWYPDGDIRSSLVVHQFYSIFLHWLPAYLIDALMFIFRQKRFMVRIQTKIRDGLELLQFFTTREWKFASENFLSLTDGLDPKEIKSFHLNFKLMSISEYMKLCILGTRQYCMKEDLKSLPRCRLQQKILYILDRGLLILFYGYIIWWIFSYSENMRNTINLDLN